jgi:ribonuclease J
MRVCIHRGTKQIGGTCIEIEAQGKRIVLDVGMPLDAGEHDDPASLLPPVPGFREPDPSLLGVVISHPHQDHYGLIQQIRSDIPVLIGAAAARILSAAADFIPAGIKLSTNTPLVDRSPITIGPFTITPYLMDHSAYDAYAMVIEAGGKRLFYSGDLRGHGRKSALFDALVRDPPPHIDALLLEGTTIGRTNTDRGFATERDLEQAFLAAFQSTPGLAMVWASGQNFDRLVTVFRAGKRAGRRFIVDLYTAAMLAATGNEHIPQSDWPEVSVFVPRWQRVKIKTSERFDLLRPHHAHRIYPEQFAKSASSSVLLFRPAMSRELEQADCLTGARLVYSMWEGYMEEERMRPTLAWLKAKDIPVETIHTSGHASVADLKRLAHAIHAKALVPIHSFHTGSYPELFENVSPKQDGVWWEA